MPTTMDSDPGIARKTDRCKHTALPGYRHLRSDLLTSLTVTSIAEYNHQREQPGYDRTRLGLPGSRPPARGRFLQDGSNGFYRKPLYASYYYHQTPPKQPLSCLDLLVASPAGPPSSPVTSRCSSVASAASLEGHDPIPTGKIDVPGSRSTQTVLPEVTESNHEVPAPPDSPSMTNYLYNMIANQTMAKRTNRKQVLNTSRMILRKTNKTTYKGTSLDRTCDRLKEPSWEKSNWPILRLTKSDQLPRIGRPKPESCLPVPIKDQPLVLSYLRTEANTTIISETNASKITKIPNARRSKSGQFPTLHTKRWC